MTSPTTCGNTAYQGIKNGPDTAKLVEVYEKILTSVYRSEIGSEISRLHEGHDPCLVAKAKKHENAHQAVQQVVNFVQTTSHAVTSMLSAYPPASIAWSGICAVLPIIANPSRQRLTMRDGLFYIMEKMEWYIAVCQIFLRSSRRHTPGMLSLRELTKVKTMNLFKALLEYEIKAVCSLYATSPLARILRSIDDWASRLEDVKNLEAEISTYLLQFGSTATTTELAQISQDTSTISMVLREMKILREQGDEEKRRAEETRRLEVIGRLSTETTCPYLERRMAVPKRVQGTCELFQTHKKYKDWLESADGGLLLLHVDPGCGKFMLSRFLLEEVLPVKMVKDTVCYFFFKDSPDQNNTATALCALIHPILTSRPELTDVVRADILENGTALTVKERVLWNIFGKITMQLRRTGRNTVCVLDALDECQKEGGWGYPEITELFQEFSQGCILLAGENMLATDRGFSEKRKEDIQKILVQKGGQQRTYLWVRLVFEVLGSNRQDRPVVWKRIVSTLPQTVNDAYDKLLERDGEADRDRVMMLLRLMIVALRPIPLRTAILLLDSGDFIDEELEDDSDADYLELESEQNFRAWVMGT
ncbi:hypothetical protein B0H66DRAFT_622041 [Apodospora peruviana]|uniref:NWD NACHT-NTPase N-terminal domain-containing protein n=1 Tax=Apodospora peruviana TaxID=516989 RepID=A0AAE0I4F8_9PEZI|nr:hypothetical protein B0H66DRAFT_622041 [Apodospora peruviana]